VCYFSVFGRLVLWNHSVCRLNHIFCCIEFPMFFLLVINPCARRAIEEYTYHISHPSVRLGINIPNEPITIRIMPFSQYLYPSFTWVFHTFGEFRITIGRLLVFRLLVVLDSPMNLPLQHCGSRRFRSFRRLRSCRLRCIAKVALEQGLSRLMRVSGNGYTMVHRKKKKQITWQNMGKYDDLYWFTSNANHMKRGTCFRSTIDAITPLMMLRHL
jgi:hypothetical protein